ncbi:hypothetical protein EV401DRAFT_1890587 [Pisolithus croceorrhizus]|nr:hypothetical protein EV401DRAFT_1890587 [Pisolithus croceorrhizus]
MSETCHMILLGMKVVPFAATDFTYNPIHPITYSFRELDWRGVIIFREMKSRKTTNMLRKSYIEGVGKTALLLYAQDRRHLAPCLQMLGHYIVLTFFDQGGSLLTAVFDIHNNPDVFLHILLGISTAPIETIGFNETVFWDHDDKKKKVLVVWKGSSSKDNKGNPTVSLEQLIFISDMLHSHGTTIWASSMKDPTSPTAQRQIIVKDSWIDPLWKFTEGIHKDAIVKAKVLHHNISLLNLLLIIWDTSHGDTHHLDFLNHLPPETCKHLQAKIQEIPYQGFLADWGYAVLINVPQAEAYTTPEPKGPSTSPSTPHHDVPPTSPISPPNTSTSVDNSVPIQIPVPSEGMDWVAYITLSELKDVHEIMLSMGRDPLPDWSQPLVDTNPLYHTISSIQQMTKGATNKACIGNMVLDGHRTCDGRICVLFDEPHQPKPEAKLTECFDVYFNTFEPSLLKTTTIQSKMGWSYNIIKHISPYFQPLVPLLNISQERIVPPMDFVDNSFCSNSPITHDEMSQALCSLDDQFLGSPHLTSSCQGTS